MLPIHNPLIIALDVASGKEAFSVVEKTSDYCQIYKIGLRLFISEGPAFVKALAQEGVHIFLDLKFHDIPQTVHDAIRAIEELPIRMFTLHGLGGPYMIRAAQKALARLQHPPLMLAVSVLTHHSSQELAALGLTDPIEQLVTRILKTAAQEGVRGCVCSPHETRAIKNVLGKEFMVINPGIRPNWAETGDQFRNLSPRQALLEGADYIVVGRPILQAIQPREAAKKIQEEILEAIPKQAFANRG